MDIQGRLFLVMTGVMSVSILAGPASANTASLKCNSHHDQIWVYDSLNTFDVEAKLKCGEDVEIIGRVRGLRQDSCARRIRGLRRRRLTSLICRLRQFTRTRLMTWV